MSSFHFTFFQLSSHFLPLSFLPSPSATFFQFVLLPSLFSISLVFIPSTSSSSLFPEQSHPLTTLCSLSHDLIHSLYVASYPSATFDDDTLSFFSTHLWWPQSPNYLNFRSSSSVQCLLLHIPFFPFFFLSSFPSPLFLVH